MLHRIPVVVSQKHQENFKRYEKRKQHYYDQFTRSVDTGKREYRAEAIMRTNQGYMMILPTFKITYAAGPKVIILKNITKTVSTLSHKSFPMLITKFFILLITAILGSSSLYLCCNQLPYKKSDVLILVNNWISLCFVSPLIILIGCQLAQ